MARILAGAVALLLALCAVALAAPDRTVTLSADTPAAAWDGTVAPFSLSPTPSQATCTKPAPPRMCDETLVEVKSAGTLDVKIDEWNAESDMDLFVLTSDADGTFGETVGESLNEGPGPEKVTAKVTPGFYLVFVNYFQAVNSGYKGTVALKPSGAATTPPPGTGPAPAPGPTPAPSPQQPAPAPTGDPAMLSNTGQLAADLKVTGRKVRKPAATVSCTVVCKVSLQLVVDKRTARKLKLGKKATVIGKATATINRKQPPPIAIKLTGKAKKKLKKAKKLTATVKATVTDSSGGQKKALSAKAKFKK